VSLKENTKGVDLSCFVDLDNAVMDVGLDFAVS
jgi:hypothetical protein